MNRKDFDENIGKINPCKIEITAPSALRVYAADENGSSNVDRKLTFDTN